MQLAIKRAPQLALNTPMVTVTDPSPPRFTYSSKGFVYLENLPKDRAVPKFRRSLPSVAGRHGNRNRKSIHDRQSQSLQVTRCQGAFTHAATICESAA